MSNSCNYCNSVVPEGNVFCLVCGAPCKVKDKTPKDMDESEIEDAGITWSESERPFIKFKIIERKKEEKEPTFFEKLCSLF